MLPSLESCAVVSLNKSHMEKCHWGASGSSQGYVCIRLLGFAVGSRIELRVCGCATEHLVMLICWDFGMLGDWYLHLAQLRFLLAVV